MTSVNPLCQVNDGIEDKKHFCSSAMLMITGSRLILCYNHGYDTYRCDHLDNVKAIL